ncbi:MULTISPECIES: hypothetical protein [unclassified Ectothiorhodospira]|uniref:hypothetical protein n=1 Tax=unclassified Ectothiorhodospira TaxID=2684909 RepID=UPI001EE942C4|nr:MULTISPECIES: hypothetical protein [unclassified Ectothiorhodospira]MCG5516700.1 hypothetical protein [Ectothiorhodospira sp. 9100]MCG5519711.1 hypothetical protein [Ectothiorhodospira sp. 9905]
MNRKPTQQSSLNLPRSLLAGAVALSLALGGMAVASAQPTGSDRPCVERGAPWGDKGRAESRQNLDHEQRQALREQREERRQAWADMSDEERQALRERRSEHRKAWREMDDPDRQALRETMQERRQAWNDMDEDERQALRERKQERRAAWEAKSPEERREMRERLRDMDPEARREWFQQQRG